MMGGEEGGREGRKGKKKHNFSFLGINMQNFIQKTLLCEILYGFQISKK